MKARKIISNKKISKRNIQIVPECDERLARIEAIQLLIPLGLQAVEDELQQEVSVLVGERYSRNDVSFKRWGYNPGSVFLGDQKVSIDVPRVRNTRQNEEITLSSYKDLQSPRIINDKIFRSVINGLSNRKYERVAEQVPETFGIKKNSISKRFITASAKRLREFMSRDLSQEDIVAIFIDGKALAEIDIVIALGITIEGRKMVLDFVETNTENHKVCKNFIQGLVDRGLNIDNEILFIIDGAKGLRKGIVQALKDKAIIQRCQWHKRENIVCNLGKHEQVRFRKKLQKAYEIPDYKKAKQALQNIRKELSLLNETSVRSLDEGFEETLTLHRLGVFDKLSESFKTTNCIESINGQIGSYLDRVDYWKNSNQRRRWVASTTLEIEQSLRKVRGFRYLKILRIAMKNMNIKMNENKSEDAA